MEQIQYAWPPTWYCHTGYTSPQATKPIRGLLRTVCKEREFICLTLSRLALVRGTGNFPALAGCFIQPLRTTEEGLMSHSCPKTEENKFRWDDNQGENKERTAEESTYTKFVSAQRLRREALPTNIKHMMHIFLFMYIMWYLHRPKEQDTISRNRLNYIWEFKI